MRRGRLAGLKSRKFPERPGGGQGSECAPRVDKLAGLVDSSSGIESSEKEGFSFFQWVRC